jgi:Trk K+ transport system NAD-binding subunit
MNPAREVVIFGATHVGVRLAERLVGDGRRVCLIDRAAVPSRAPAWEQISSDFAVPPDIGAARVVYVVTDEDKLNIRLALAIRRVSRPVPVVITLKQSRLGEKLARHLENFAFINPPELAAAHFVDAIDAPRPAGADESRAVPAPAEPEVRERWQPDPLILRAVMVILAIGALATGYFHVAEKLRWIDSLYFVVTMMATVGFGDISLKDSSTLSKLVGVAVMIASVVNTAVIFALITDSLLKKRLVLSFGRRRIAQTGHIVVAGVGSVGLRVVEQLRARGESVVVIDSQENGRYLPAIYAKRLPAIIGDARLERTLRDAGLARAKALLSVTSDDLANLEIGLNAKSVNPDMRVVLRIFDQELAQSLREQLDIHFAFSMSAIAAEVLAKFAESPPRAAP